LVGAGVRVGVEVCGYVGVGVGVGIGVWLDVGVGVGVMVVGPETITVAPVGKPAQNDTMNPSISIAVNVGEAVFSTLANVTVVPEVACFAFKRIVPMVKVPPVWLCP
jgi:hypothetical protein